MPAQACAGYHFRINTDPGQKLKQFGCHRNRGPACQLVAIDKWQRITDQFWFVISYFTTSPMVQNLSTLIYSKARIGIEPTLNALSALMFLSLLILLLIVNRRAGKTTRL